MERRAAKIGDQILEEASAWFIEFTENEVDYAGRAEFNAWLRRSPECVRAFLQVAVFWEDAGTFRKWSQIDSDGLIARAEAEQNVVHIGSLAPTRSSSQSGHTAASPPALAAAADEGATKIDTHGTVVRRGLRRGWFAAAAILLLSIAIVSWYSVYLAPTYATGIGEQRSIALEDGSVVELNARSRLRVHFTPDQRSVDLLEGQALFTVAKNPARPFVVTTDQTRVRAVGTQFDVYRKSARTVVTVVEGRVAVNPAHANPRSGARTHSPASARVAGAVTAPARPEVFVAAGEQVTVTPVEVAPPAVVNTAIATAWTEKKLIFESAPLREVVEEFNRYNRQQLIIRDPELFDLHVSGVFPSTDSSRMVEFLRQRFGVTMSSSGGNIEIHRRNDSASSSAGETNTF